MASKAQQAQRYIKIINQQLEILTGEKQSVMETLDHAFNQVLSEVNAWVNGGHVNHTTYAEMSNRIQQIINLFMAKSAEISDLEIDDSKSDSGLLQTTAASSNNLRNPKTRYTRDQEQDETMSSRVKTVQVCGDPIGADDTYITTTRFAILEEAVFSLRKTTEQIQEKQENVNKKLEILTNTNLKSKKKFKERITELEKTNNENQERLAAMERSSTESSSNVDDLFESVTNVDVKLSSLENENKYINASMNELNEEISSVRSCSNDALMSIQDLSKSVESTNQHYNDMSNKMNQLEISINLMSSQYTEQFENMKSHKQDSLEDSFNLVCQILAKRLTPLEELREHLNTTLNTRKQMTLKADGQDKKIMELSTKISQIESKCCHQDVGFYVSSKFNFKVGFYDLKKFKDVSINYGNYFDASSGEFTAPLHGLYLISISAMITERNQIIVGYYDRNKSLFNTICRSLGNQTITCCSKLKPGDKVFLKLDIDEPVKGAWVDFSCCQING